MVIIKSLTKTPLKLALLSLFFYPCTAQANNSQSTSGGLTLAEVAGARAVSMGEAFSAIANDITGMRYNPAALKSLETSQASFFYRSGIADDSFGQFMLGSPMGKGSLGFSIGYFDGGNIHLFDGVSRRSVTAQRDILGSAAYAFQVGLAEMGVAGKYLTSELAEQKSASALAADFGIQIPINDRLRFGSALQNLGTKLKFNKEGDSLPRSFRAGLSILARTGSYPTLLLADGVFDLNDSHLTPALGVEQSAGPLAFRAGYKGTQGLNQFSFGVGIFVSKFSVDYSFGLVDELDSTHMISLSMRFNPLVKNENLVHRANQSILETKSMGSESHPKTSPAAGEKSTTAGKNFSTKKSWVYIVKEGDTLGKIAQRIYGDKNQWKVIYNANADVLKNPTSIEIGQKINLPVQQ
jgi:LysM repeat protein